jgi:cell division septal protein FtsQ
MPLELKPRVRLATRRRRARFIGAALACLAAIGAVFGGSLLSYHERFAINDLNVVGAQALSAAAVESAFGERVDDGVRHFFSRTNIFLYPYSEIQQALLLQFPLLQAVSFTRESMLSQALTITVYEREPKYLWCSHTCYFMDANGFVFALAANPTGFLTFRGGLDATKEPVGQTFMRGRLEQLVDFVEGLKNSGLAVASASIDNETDISINLTDGYYIKTTFGSSAEQLARNLALAISTEALAGKLLSVEYIDLRFGNRVYYRLESSNE